MAVRPFGQKRPVVTGARPLEEGLRGFRGKVPSGGIGQHEPSSVHGETEREDIRKMFRVNKRADFVPH